MKIQVLQNRIKVNIQDDFQRAKEYFARHGLPIEWEFKDINVKGYKVITQDFGSFVGNRFQIEGHEKLIPLSRDYITVFAFNGNEFPSKKIPTSKCETYAGGVLVTLMTYKEGDVVGETYLTLLHEMMHAINRQLSLIGTSLPDPMDIFIKYGVEYRYHKNDQPDGPDSNFGEAWKILTPHLHKLDPKKKLNHFTPDEVKGLKPDFAEKLDLGREYSDGMPWVLTSTLRTPEKNKAVGGSPTSAHLDGTGADVRARNWVEVGKIVDGARKAGITGITVYKESPHVHLDMKPYRLEVK